jgi:nucleoside-diphosphate-sugar epimerase
MWRPLVDVRDAADAMIAALEAPADLVRGEVFNVLHANYQIRELAMLVAGSVQLAGRPVNLREAPLPPRTRNYECSNAKLAQRLGFIPCHSVVDAVSRLLATIDLGTLEELGEARYYNIRWLESLAERTGGAAPARGA